MTDDAIDHACVSCGTPCDCAEVDPVTGLGCVECVECNVAKETAKEGGRS